MSRTIISLDTDHIKQYVFATGVLKEIRGASSILDELNRQEMAKTIKTGDPSFDDERNIIYANGGQGMFCVVEDKAEACIQAVKGLYRKETITASVTGEMHPFSDQNLFQQDFQTLGYKLRLKKDSKQATYKPVTHSLLKLCDSCGVEYATCQGENTDEVICRSCQIKREKDQEMKRDIQEWCEFRKPFSEKPFKIWERLLKELFRHDAAFIADRPDDIDILGRLSSSSSKNYIGLLYADGNDMGKNLEMLQSEQELQCFSNAVDQGIFQAVLQAIKIHLSPRNGRFPFDILLLGGDDLVMLTVADKAIETAMMIERVFREYTKREYSDPWSKKPLSLSIGVAIAHAKFPFNNLLDLAENLLKFAKTERSKNPGIDQGLINFQVINASSSLDFQEDYKHVYLSKESKTGGGIQKFVRTLRPYYAEHPTDSRTLHNLLQHIKELKSNAFPQTKMQALYELCMLDYGDALIEGLVFQTRLKKKEKEQIRKILSAMTPPGPQVMDFFPWFKGVDACYSPFVDVAELYNFIA